MLTAADINHQRVAVLGAGRSGVGAALLLAQKGGKVLLSDAGSVVLNEEQLAQLQSAGVEVESGGHSDAVMKADWWVLSPGIALDSPIVQKGRILSIPMTGELELAAWFCKAPVVAVTGSNGKSTVTTWIGEVFKNAGIPCVVAGNIGESFASRVEQTVPHGVAVVEVSSFQLETIQSFRPAVSVLLNLTPDHLDRHGSMVHYGRTKARIFMNQQSADRVVFNGRDERIAALVSESEAALAAFDVCTDEMDCARVEGEHLIVRIDQKNIRVLPVADLALPGRHNVANALATAMTGALMGVDSRVIAQTLADFKGLPHRLEWVREHKGVQWINDSKATNVDAMQYAIGSYSEQVVLIAGGRDKNSDFTLLRPDIETRVSAVILIGEAAGKMEKSFEGLCSLYHEDSLEKAVLQAEKISRSGQVVLLSPGCASFDMFRNFEDRGEQFKQLVNGL